MNHLLKRPIVCILIVAVAIVFVSNSPVFSQSQQTVANNKEKDILSAIPNVVATVNGVKVDKNRLMTALQTVEFQYIKVGKHINKDELNNLIKQLIDNLIEEELLLQYAKKNKILITKEEIKKELDALQARFQSKEAFDDWLKANNMSLDNIRAEIDRKLILGKTIQTKIANNIKINEKDEKEFYEKNPDKFKRPESIRASHILLEAPSNASSELKKEKKKTTEDILKQIKGGKDFAEMAKKFSNDSSASRGGDLGYFTRGQMVPSFEEAAFSLKVGEVSPVVETPFGYHIIKVYDKKGPGKLLFNEVKGQINTFLLQQESRKRLGELINSLTKVADIKHY